ncbi:MAG: ABC transporter ATP-binding protein, partial [Chroococcales cyanobacterium]
VLVGPSGCGKSTLLRMIAGLEKATKGRIYIGETVVNNVPARQRDVAMVFQNYALYPHLTVAENLAFGLRMRGVDEIIIAERVEKVARSLNIEHLLNRKPKQLSGGQQQRVALGRAIAREPKVFLLDEPLSNLDAQLRDEMRAQLKQLHSRLGITTIYVTHDQVEAMTLADHVVVLNQGRIQQIGHPQDVYAYPANRMVATFLGNPAMNILPATYLEGKFEIQNQCLPCPNKIKQYVQMNDGQGLELGIRPEAIQLGLASPSIEEQPFDQFGYSELKVIVDLVEPLGKETLVRGRLPKSNILLNFYASGKWLGEQGDRVSIQLDLNQLFVFDPSSGETLYPPISD